MHFNIISFEVLILSATLQAEDHHLSISDCDGNMHDEIRFCFFDCTLFGVLCLFLFSWLRTSCLMKCQAVANHFFCRFSLLRIERGGWSEQRDSATRRLRSCGHYCG